MGELKYNHIKGSWPEMECCSTLMYWHGKHYAWMALSSVKCVCYSGPFWLASGFGARPWKYGLIFLVEYEHDTLLKRFLKLASPQSRHVLTPCVCVWRHMFILRAAVGCWRSGRRHCTCILSVGVCIYSLLGSFGCLESVNVSAGGLFPPSVLHSAVVGLGFQSELPARNTHVAKTFQRRTVPCPGLWMAGSWALDQGGQ